MKYVKIPLITNNGDLFDVEFFQDGSIGLSNKDGFYCLPYYLHKVGKYYCFCRSNDFDQIKYRNKSKKLVINFALGYFSVMLCFKVFLRH